MKIKINHLNWTNAHVNSDLIFSDIFQSCHGKSNVIQIFDWTAQALVEILNKVENFYHLCPILGTTVLAICHTPCFCLIGQTNLEVLYKINKMQF